MVDRCAWTIFLKIDVVVSARGKIIPIGDVKVVQPLETGVITKIHVKEGDYVKKGAILLEIDPSVDTADLEGKERNLKYSQLSMDRINAVLDEKEFAPRIKRIIQGSCIQAQDSSLSGAKERALKSLKEEIATLDKLLVVTSEDERRQKALVEIGAMAENRYRDKMKERMNLERERDSKLGQVRATSGKTSCRLFNKCAKQQYFWKRKSAV